MVPSRIEGPDHPFAKEDPQPQYLLPHRHFDAKVLLANMRRGRWEATAEGAALRESGDVHPTLESNASAAKPTLLAKYRHEIAGHTTTHIRLDKQISADVSLYHTARQQFDDWDKYFLELFNLSRATDPQVGATFAYPNGLSVRLFVCLSKAAATVLCCASKCLTCIFFLLLYIYISSLSLISAPLCVYSSSV